MGGCVGLVVDAASGYLLDESLDQAFMIVGIMRQVVALSYPGGYKIQKGKPTRFLQITIMSRPKAASFLPTAVSA